MAGCSPTAASAPSDPAAARGERVQAIEVNTASDGWAPLDDAASYRYAALYHPEAPGLLNGLDASDIELVRDGAGHALDVVEVVADYLAKLPGRRAEIETGRIRLIRGLPPPVFGNPELQPLKGGGSTWTERR